MNVKFKNRQIKVFKAEQKLANDGVFCSLECLNQSQQKDIIDTIMNGIFKM